jgi:hypothetical protein
MDAWRRVKFSVTRERGGFLYSRFHFRWASAFSETTTGQAGTTGKKRWERRGKLKKQEDGRKKLRNPDFGESVAITL